ncbi:MAG: hypothetical protein AAFO99_12345, partial [Bacteroidota bacterium]
MGLFTGMPNPVKADTNLLTLCREDSCMEIAREGIKSLITATTLANVMEALHAGCHGLHLTVNGMGERAG